MKTGGLGKLMVPGEYESWVCVTDDPCALGGDFFFCYTYNEASKVFVPWEQHSKLKLFNAKVPSSSASVSTTLEEVKSENKLLQELLRKFLKK